MRAQCCRYLARREYSRKELLQRLETKGIGRVLAVHVVDELAEQGYQSDQRYCESLIRHRASQGYGEFRIRAELAERGIAPDLADFSGYDWDAALEHAYRHRFGLRGPDSVEESAARYRYFIQRGFSSERIKHLLRRLCDDGAASD